MLHEKDVDLATALDSQSFPLQETLQGSYYEKNERPENPRNIIKGNHSPDGDYATACIRYLGPRAEVTKNQDGSWSVLEHLATG